MADSPNRARRRLLTWANVERLSLAVIWLLIIVASAAGYFGMRDWRLELFANFKMQYYLGALVLCVIAAWRRYRVLLGLGVVALLWNGWEIFNFAPQSVEAATRTYRAISANVYSQNDQVERTEAWIRQQEPDFVALIEVTNKWDDALDRLKDILPYRQDALWGRQDRIFGSVLLSRYPPTDHRFNYAGVGSIPAEFITPDGPLLVLLVHPQAPMNEKAWEYRGHALGTIANFASEQADKRPILVMGDMNTTPWSPYYRNFVTQSVLDPVVTEFLPRRTWPTTNPLLWIPIDHFFLSDQLAAVSQWTGPDLGSDHYPIALDFCFAPQSE